MKNKSMLIVFIILFSSITSNGQVDLKMSIKEFKLIDVDSAFYILTTSAQFERGYRLMLDSIIYQVTLNEKGQISYIETSDSTFQTSDGLKVGIALSEVKKKSKISEAKFLRGWGRYIKLNSGWYAVFDYDQPLGEHSIIRFFFKK